MNRSPRHQAAALVGFLLLVAAASFAGNAATRAGLGTWYEELEKPTWTPPGSLIGAVWTVLFVLMAVAAWLVWREVGWRGGRVPLGLFLVQLALNVLWSVLFFGLRSPGAALVGIVLLAVAIAGTARAFAKVSKPAAGLLLPYFAWVLFAGALNATIWRLQA